MMSGRYSFFLLLIWLAFETPSISAQAREISKQEFEVAEKGAFSKLHGSTYRVRMTAKPDPASVKSDHGGLTSQVSEYVSTDRHRIVSVWQTSNGTRKEETVVVGDRKFVRKNDGAWEDVSKRDPNRYSMYGDPAAQEKEIATYRNLGLDRVGGIDAELIEEMIYREFTIGDRLLKFGYVNRLWISKDGRLVKREWKNSGGDGLVSSYSVSEYEYDPNIKIEAPLK